MMLDNWQIFLYSMAKIQHSLARPLFQLLTQSHIDLIHDQSNSQGLANILWACVKVGYRNDALFVTDPAKLPQAFKTLLKEGNIAKSNGECLFVVSERT